MLERPWQCRLRSQLINYIHLTYSSVCIQYLCCSDLNPEEGTQASHSHRLLKNVGCYVRCSSLTKQKSLEKRCACIQRSLAMGPWVSTFTATSAHHSTLQVSFTPNRSCSWGRRHCCRSWNAGFLGVWHWDRTFNYWKNTPTAVIRGS